MTDYTWPDDLAPFAQSFWLQPHVGRSESPFTRQQKVYGLSAPRWMTTLGLRGGYDNQGSLRDVGGRVDAMLVKLAGGVNRALIYDFRRSNRSGNGRTMDDLTGEFAFSMGETFTLGEVFEFSWTAGAPSNAAASAGATALNWSGFEPYKTIFKAGDYVGGDGRAHIILADGIADPDGNLSVIFSPALKSSVAEGAAIYTKVTSPFRVAADDAGSNATQVGDAVSYEIQFTEDI